jgi:hypothetical protein
LGKRNEKKCTKKETKAKKKHVNKAIKEKDKKTKFSTSSIIKK